MYYVYALIDPRTDAPFYIGKGKGRRINAHELEAQNGGESQKCRVIREINEAGLQVKKVKIAEFAREASAYKRERQEIQRIGMDNLTNLTVGGGRISLPKKIDRCEREVIRDMKAVDAGMKKHGPRRFVAMWLMQNAEALRLSTVDASRVSEIANGGWA